MKISQRGIDLIKECEGYRERAYQCQAGRWTIGYGHTSGVMKGDKCTMEQAEDYLKTDLATVERFINVVVKVPITQSQYDALCSFVFNVGIGAFKNSTMLGYIKHSHFKLAADQFDRWVYAKGAVSNGLKIRRKKEKELFLSEI